MSIQFKKAIVFIKSLVGFYAGGGLFLLLVGFFNIQMAWANTDYIPVLVKDINGGSLDSSIDKVTDVNGTLFFFADDGVHGSELWKSDGTTTGTVMVKDINSGASGSHPQIGLMLSYGSTMVSSNGILFFTADDGVHGRELWRSDGSSAGTYMVKDLSGELLPSGLTDVNGTIFFVGKGSTFLDFELWKSDGTADGTVLVKNINPIAFADSNIRSMIEYNGFLYFEAYDGADRGLWRSDGTEAGTFLVSDINFGKAQIFNGSLFFSGGDDSPDFELWTSNGTDAGTTLLKDIFPGPNGGGDPSRFTEVNGTLFFSADDGFSNSLNLELWKTDGTESGTVLVKDINNNGLYLSNSYPQNLTDVNGTLFFRASDDVNGSELWKSDGTEAGTILVKNIRDNAVHPINPGSDPNSLTNVNGTLFFSADNGVDGNELWQSNGTDAGTIQVKDIYSGAASSDPSSFININGTLLFVANNGTHGKELWKLVPEGTPPEVTSPVTGSTLSTSSHLFAWDINSVNVTEWWLYIGSSLGSNDIHNSGSLNASIRDQTVSNLPIDGTSVYLRLWYKEDGIWKSVDSNYTSVTLNISPPEILTPTDDTTLSGDNETFIWDDNNTNVTEWWLYLGNSTGTHNIYNSGSLNASTLQQTVANLPTDGSTIYARLWYKENGIWNHTDSSYIATLIDVSPPNIVSPPAGSTLPYDTATFAWEDNNTDVTEWWLYVGSSLGSLDIYNSGSLTSTTHLKSVSGLPSDGSVVYVRLWYKEVGAWKYVDRNYNSIIVNISPPNIYSPNDGSTLSGNAETFYWSNNNTNVTEWWLYIGTTQGGLDIYNSGSLSTATNSATVSVLPSDGSIVHARLWYKEAGAWLFVDSSYDAFDVDGSIFPPEIISPPNDGETGEILDSTVTFEWVAYDTSVSDWRLDIGTSLGASDIHNSGSLGAATNFHTISGLPIDGNILFVRLWYEDNGVWESVDISYETIPVLPHK